MRRTLLALAVVCALSTPASALAQSDPFGPLPAQTPTQAPVQTISPTTTSGTGGSLTGTQEALIIAAGMVLLAGIGWAIVRDAHQRAPVAVDEPTADERAARRSAQQQARDRAKAKAARQQRKRNRARR